MILYFRRLVMRRLSPRRRHLICPRRGKVVVKSALHPSCPILCVLDAQEICVCVRACVCACLCVRVCPSTRHSFPGLLRTGRLSWPRFVLGGQIQDRGRVCRETGREGQLEGEWLIKYAGPSRSERLNVWRWMAVFNELIQRSWEDSTGRQ